MPMRGCELACPFAGEGEAGGASRLAGGRRLPLGVPGRSAAGATREGGAGDGAPVAVRLRRSSSIERSLGGSCPTAFQVASGPTSV